MASKYRQSFSGGRPRESVKVKDSKESPPVPDSTTEPAPRPAQKFQEGDEVFFQTETGQQMLGTVAEVRGETCLVQFGDGTEKMAQFKRLRKLFEEEDDVSIVECKRKKPEPSVQAPAVVHPPPPRPQQICTSCGIHRRISANKAKLYENDSRKFECRMCIKNKAMNKLRVEIMVPTKSSSKGNLSPEMPRLPLMTSPPTALSLPSRVSPNTPQPPHLRPIQFSIISTKKHYCFSCEQLVQPFDSVGCNFCDRPCHLSCLHLNPTPLNGDTFWHLVCSTCGNQKASEKVEMKFSVRRSISSWGDIAYLLISCLSVVQTHRMFDFEREMLPFMEKHLESLHLPRQYKSQPSEARMRFILTALNNSTRRFQNGKEFRLKPSLWGIREVDLPLKHSFATTPSPTVGQLLKTEKPISKMDLPLSPTGLIVHPSPELLRFIVSTKNKDLSPSPVPIGKDEDSSDTTSRSDTTESFIDRDWGTGTEETRSDIFSMPLETRSESGSFASSSASTTSGCSTVSSVASSRRIVVTKKERGTDSTRSVGSTLDTSAEVQQVYDKRKAKATTRIYRKRKYSEGSNSPVSKSGCSSPLLVHQPTTAFRKRTKIENLPMSPFSSSSDQIYQSKNSIHKDKGLVRTISADRISKKGSPWKLVRDVSPDSDKGENNIPLTKLKLRIDTPSKSSQSRTPERAELPPVHQSLCLELPRQLEELRAIESITNFENPIPHGFALKSSATTPLSPLQVQVAQTIEENEEKKQRKQNRSKKSKISTEGGDNVIVPTARGKRGPGRPKGTSATVSPVAATVTNKPLEPASSVNRTLRPGKASKANSTIPIVSRRVGTFNSISERRPEPLPPIKHDVMLLNFLNEALFEAGLFAGYRIECLPSTPATDVERKTETLKVFSHIRTEKETEKAASLLSRSVAETRSLTRRKSELFVGSQKHDLNDLDSYEVLGKRMGADGITRYQVLWKRSDDEDDFLNENDDEMDVDVEARTVVEPPHPFSALNLFPGSKVAEHNNGINVTTESLWEAVKKCQMVTQESMLS